MKLLTLPLLALAVSCQGQADVIYDSTGDGQFGDTQLSSTPSLYDSFANTSASAVSITGLEFVLNDFNCGPETSCSATVDVGLYTSSADAPGVPWGSSPLATFTLDSASTPLGSLFTETLTGLGSKPLLPGAQYWIGLSLVEPLRNPAFLSWEFGKTLTSPTETGQFWQAPASTFGGACPSGSTTSGSNCIVPNSDTNTPFEMQVAAGVPEPSSFGLLLSTFSLIGVFAAWRRLRPI